MLTNCAESYAQFRIQEFILRYSKEYCRAIGGSLASTRTMLEKFKNQLELDCAESLTVEDILSKRTAMN